MKSITRRKFTPEFKAKVALEAVKELQTMETLCKKYELHPSQLNNWKKEFIANASSVFSQDKKDEKIDNEALIQTLYAQIGALTVANDWLKKKLQ
jgi:transposase